MLNSGIEPSSPILDHTKDNQRSKFGTYTITQSTLTPKGIVYKLHNFYRCCSPSLSALNQPMPTELLIKQG